MWFEKSTSSTTVELLTGRIGGYVFMVRREGRDQLTLILCGMSTQVVLNECCVERERRMRRRWTFIPGKKTDGGSCEPSLRGSRVPSLGTFLEVTTQRPPINTVISTNNVKEKEEEPGSKVTSISLPVTAG